MALSCITTVCSAQDFQLDFDSVQTGVSEIRSTNFILEGGLTPIQAFDTTSIVETRPLGAHSVAATSSAGTTNTGGQHAADTVDTGNRRSASSVSSAKSIASSAISNSKSSKTASSERATPPIKAQVQRQPTSARKPSAPLHAAASSSSQSSSQGSTWSFTEKTTLVWKQLRWMSPKVQFGMPSIRWNAIDLSPCVRSIFTSITLWTLMTIIALQAVYIFVLRKEYASLKKNKNTRLQKILARIFRTRR